MAIEVKVPALGESIVEATVGKWLKGEGERVETGQPVVELETDKVNMEVPAPGSGVLASVLKKEGETVAIGDILALVEVGAGAPAPNVDAPKPPAAATTEAPVARQSAPPPQAPLPAPAPASAPIPPGPTTPMVRRLAAELGVDLTRLQGSGPRGRITPEDVKTLVTQTPPATPAVPSPAAPSPRPTGERHETRTPLSRRRLTIAKRLVEAKNTAAMLTTFNEIDMSAVMDLRKREKDAFRERFGVGLGFMSFFTKASVSALQAFPRLNAEIDGSDMVEKSYYDIGIAVSTEDGLVVPVLRDADHLSFWEIEKGIGELADRARKKSLTLEDLRGGTFTITNGGIFGSLFSTPILNTPQVGILGMHTIQERPIAKDGQVVIRPMMYVALSYDHRLIDGSEAVRFLVHIKETIENPLKLLLER